MKLAAYGNDIVVTLSRQFRGKCLRSAETLKPDTSELCSFVFQYHTILKELSYGE